MHFYKVDILGQLSFLLTHSLFSLQLEENLFDCVSSLVKGVDVSFWGSGRFLVCTDRQMASHKDGNSFCLCMSLSVQQLKVLTSYHFRVWRNKIFLVPYGVINFKISCSLNFFLSRILSSGKIRLSKTWRGFAVPELVSVSPIAVVSGQETPLLLRGRGLTSPGTKYVIAI